MPDYTKLNSDIQEVLEKRAGARYFIEGVYHYSESEMLVLPRPYDFQEGSYNSQEQRLDLQNDREPIHEFRVFFNDPDGFFDPNNLESFFHVEVTTVYLTAVQRQRFIQVSTGTEFRKYEKINIKGYGSGSQLGVLYSETGIVKSFTKGASFNTIELFDDLTYRYSAGSTVNTDTPEGKRFDLRLRVPESSFPIRLFRTRLTALPQSRAGRGVLTMAPFKYMESREEMIGADTGSTTKIKMIDTDGSEVDGINVESSAGTFDRSQVTVYDDKIIDSYLLSFIDANTYRITGGKMTSEERDIRNGLVAMDTGYDLWTSGYYFYATTVDGDYLYCLVSYGGDSFLKIFDVSDRSSPTEVGSLALSTSLIINTHTGIVIEGNVAYIAFSDAGDWASQAIYSVDITTKSSPSLLQEYGATENGSDFYPHCLAISGNYIFAGGYDGLYVIDKSTPSAMTPAGSLTGVGSPNYLDDCSDIEIDGNYVYLTTTKGMTVIDISTPSSPSLTAFYSTGSVYGIEISGSHAYLSVDGDTIESVDISTPSSPVQADTLSGAAHPTWLNVIRDIRLSGSYLYVMSAYDSSITIVDISDPTDMETFEAVGAGNSGALYYLNEMWVTFEVASNYIYIWVGSGLQIWRVAPPIKTMVDGENLEIPAKAFGGTFAAGESIYLVTGKTFAGVNPVEAYVDLLEHIGYNLNDINCSSKFGNKTIGTLMEGYSSGETSIKVRINMPAYIKTGETLTISEGSTTEDVTVNTGVGVTAQYPPYIELTISALSNNFTKAASVIWKARGSYDTDFNMDYYADYFETAGVELSMTFDRQMKKAEALNALLENILGYNFEDNWGRKSINCIIPKTLSSPPVLSKSTNVCLPLPKMENAEKAVTSLKVFYGFDYPENKFAKQTSHPHSSTGYLLENAVEKEIYLVGIHDDETAKIIVDPYYKLMRDGVQVFTFYTTHQGVLAHIGDGFDFDIDKPAISDESEIIMRATKFEGSDIIFEFKAYIMKDLG